MRDTRHQDPQSLFAELAGELEAGSGDPEAFFAAHPEHAAELRELFRRWQALDGLLRSLGGGTSLVQATLEALHEDASEEHCRAALSRLAEDRTFGRRYELGPELGRGGMGIVRRARDRVLGRDLALKVVRERSAGERGRARRLRRFLAEAELTGRLQHPSIVTIHDLGLDDDGRVYFTMPLVEGQSLEQVMALAARTEAGWSRARLLEVLLRIADTLAFAHARGVLHRDLKPSNVLVGRFGEVYVLDWGLARALDVGGVGATDSEAVPPGEAGMTLEGEVLGTPAYMAPEQALGQPVDARADVHALGAILYQCLAGSRPYSSAGRDLSPEETLLRLRAGPPEDLTDRVPSVAPELAAIARKAMARKPDQRYPSMLAFGADLRAYLDGRVVEAHERGVLARLRKWIGRNRGLALASTLALAALLGAAYFQGRATLERQDARRQEQRGLRRSLLDALVAIRRPETAGQVSVVLGGAASGPVASVPASAATTLAEDHARYLDVLIRHGCADLAQLDALGSEATPEERQALLDELYWLELRLVPLTRVEGRTDRELLLAQLGHLDGWVARFERRPWRLELRAAWQRLLAGEPRDLLDLAEPATMLQASAEELEWLSLLLSSVGDDARLRPVLVRLVELDPGSFWGHFRLATLSSGAERLVHAHAATALQPRSMQAWYNRGWNHQNIPEAPFGDLEEAQRCYERALELEPGTWQAAINLTYLLSVDEAIELLERTLAVRPDAFLYLRLAERWRTAQDCEACTSAARRGLQQFPENAALWAMLGECLMWLDRPAEARPALERAVTLDPKHAVALEHLGRACLALDDPEAALQHLERSLTLGNPGAREALVELREQVKPLADAAAWSSRIDAALQLDGQGSNSGQ